MFINKNYKKKYTYINFFKCIYVKCFDFILSKLSIVMGRFDIILENPKLNTKKYLAKIKIL